MEIMDFVEIALTPAFLFAFFFWGADKFLSKKGAEKLWSIINGSVQNPDQSTIAESLNDAFRALFNLEIGFMRFLVSAVIITLICMITLLALYSYNTAGLYSQLSSAGFLSQFLGQGFVVVFLVNFISFSIYSFWPIHRLGLSAPKVACVIIIDIFFKAFMFVCFTAITYMIFADFLGRFSGDRMLALAAVKPTIMGALTLDNLTSVYLYSIAISSFPFFVIFLIHLLVVGKKIRKIFQAVVFYFPFENKPIRAVAFVVAVFLGLFNLAIAPFLGTPSA